MLISRCAWHRRYHGYPKFLGISSWQGLQPSFTDGICQKCAARVRADHLRSRVDRGASADRREHAWMPGLAAVSLGLAVALVLVARPTHELPPLPPVTAALPQAEVPMPSARVAVPADEEPSAAVPTHVVERPRPPAAHAAVRPAKAARRPLVVEPARHAWIESSAPARLVVRVAWAPYRTLATRDTPQSP